MVYKLTSRRYDEWFMNMHNFHEWVGEHGLHEPDDPLRNPFTAYHKQEGTPVWAIMAQNPEKIQAFQTGMAGIDVAIPPVGHFEFGSLKNTPEESEKGVVELVDVGGGHGVVLKRILDAHPELTAKNCYLQERPDVIDMAKSSGVLPSDTGFMPHDFMTPNPIKGRCSVRFLVLDLANCLFHRCKSLLHAYDPSRLCR